MKIMSFIIAFTLFFYPSVVLAQDNNTEALKIWKKIHEVFSHPRCANCHVGPDNIPRWSGPSYGNKVKLHGMFVSGDESRIGAKAIACNTCHAKQNSKIPHGPPGAKVWALAPVEMQWFGKTSKEICEQVKDPERNGGRSLSEVADHIDHDALVHWGWSPGPGREPAPYSKDELVKFIKLWEAAGANCPS